MKKIQDRDLIINTLRSIESGSVRKQAAKILGVSERTLQKRMNFYNITFRDWRPKKEKSKREGWGGYKLNMQKAKEIRKLYDKGEEIKDIAKMYEVTFSTISRIVRNVTYRENKVVFGGKAEINMEYKP